MLNHFERIGGNEYNFIPPEIASKIRQAGTRKVVFVEGETDERILGQILLKEPCAGKAFFIAVDGFQNVKDYLKKMINRNKKDFFGIIDRDFKSDEEREKEIQKYNEKLYIHLRYTIENYLIETPVLREFLADQQQHKNMTESELEKMIHSILKKLISIMAGNWVLQKLNHLKEEKGCFVDVEYFKLSTPDDKEIILNNILKRLMISNCNFNKENIKSEYEQILATLENITDNISELHKYVSGKYFFVKFGKKLKEESIDKKGFSLTHKEIRFHLARILKDEGIQDEFKEILKFINVA